MQAPTHPIIVLGSSAGGWEALPVVLENLPEDLPAALFVAQHLSSQAMGDVFLYHLSKRSQLPCAFAVDGEPIKPGRIYLAPPDYHLLLTKEGIRITHGPRENSFRPSIDTLFRSAAAHFDSSVIGVILSGLRDDGVEGLSAISRSGGITVVQDPKNAPYPEMPQAALAHMDIDYTVSSIEMGLVLTDLVFRPRKPSAAIPQDVLNEAHIAQRVLTGIEAVEQVATPSPYTCPACQGVLWDVNHGNQVHSFRCHVGHAYSPFSLLGFKATEIEETLWACLRLLEEQKRMLLKFSKEDVDTSRDKRIAENQLYIDRLRGMLLREDIGTQ